MSRVLVTGASGFIGRSLVRELASRGWSVVAAGRTSVGRLPPGVIHRPVPDLQQLVEWDSYVADVDCVVHLAGIAHTHGVSADAYKRVNVQATVRLADAAARRGARMVFISSVRAQTGPCADGILTEDDPPQPTDAYGRSKLAAEEGVRQSGVRHAILRPTVVYGAGVGGNLASLMRLAAMPCPLPFGALENRRSLLALQNLNSAIAFLLARAELDGETYLVADADRLTFRELMATLRLARGRGARLLRVPPRLLESCLRLTGRRDVWQRLGGSLVVSTRKLNAAGWQAQVGTRDGLLALCQGPGA